MKDDVISRQAAIDMIRLYREDDAVDLDELESSIAMMPSAQPEIIRCKDCKHNLNCDIQYHAQAGDMFFCAGAERRTDE